MSTALSKYPVPASGIFRISVEKYRDMIGSGSLTEDDPVELLEGVLVFKIPKDEPHNVAVDLADDVFSATVPEGWSYRNQGSLTLNDGEPEPDGAVVRGDRRQYVRLGRKPSGDDTAFVIEISSTTLTRDRTIKLRSYARAGIAVYWIVNLIDRVVEVYTRPAKNEPEPTYQTKATYAATDDVPLVIDGQTVGRVNVADLLP